MKKNKLSRLAILVLALVIVSMMIISGTYSKYTSSATGTDSVAVAKWDIKLNTAQIATGSAETVDVSLFDTIVDTANGVAETDVDETQTDKLIAPGTKGEFDLVLVNDSEVNATADVNLSVTNASSIPLEYSTNGTTWSSTIADANVSGAALSMNGGTTTVTIYWRWVYSSGAVGDNADTVLGIAARTTRPEVTVSAQVVATQVD